RKCRVRFDTTPKAACRNRFEFAKIRFDATIRNLGCGYHRRNLCHFDASSEKTDGTAVADNLFGHHQRKFDLSIRGDKSKRIHDLANASIVLRRTNQWANIFSAFSSRRVDTGKRRDSCDSANGSTINSGGNGVATLPSIRSPVVPPTHRKLVHSGSNKI